MKKLLQMASSVVLIGLVLAACSPLVPATNGPATSIPGPAQLTRWTIGGRSLCYASLGPPIGAADGHRDGRRGNRDQHH